MGRWRSWESRHAGRDRLSVWLITVVAGLLIAAALLGTVVIVQLAEMPKR